MRGTIKCLRLTNFQLHQDIEIEFMSGLNIIRGDSGKGKTTILRGICWILENDPSGFEFQHNPIIAGTGKKELSKYEITQGYLEFEDGTIIIRERNSKGDVNRYVLNDTELVSFGQSVPEEVTQIVDIPSYCIQRQHPSFSNNDDYKWSSPYFLISDSPAEVARKINELVGQQVIDGSTRRVEAIVKESKNEAERCDKKIEELQKQINDLSWLEDAEHKLKRLESKQSKLIGLEQQLNKLSQNVERLTDLSKTRQRLDYIDSAERVYFALQSKIETFTSLNTSCKKLDKLDQDLMERKESIVKIQSRIVQESDLESLDKKIERYKTFVSKHNRLLRIVEQLEQIYEEHERLKKLILCERLLNNLDSQIDDLAQVNDNIQAISQLIVNIEKNMQQQIHFRQIFESDTQAYDKMLSEIEVCPIFNKPITTFCRESTT